MSSPTRGTFSFAEEPAIRITWGDHPHGSHVTSQLNSNFTGRFTPDERAQCFEPGTDTRPSMTEVFDTPTLVSNLKRIVQYNYIAEIALDTPGATKKERGDSIGPLVDKISLRVLMDGEHGETAPLTKLNFEKALAISLKNSKKNKTPQASTIVTIVCQANRLNFDDADDFMDWSRITTAKRATPKQQSSSPQSIQVNLDHVALTNSLGQVIDKQGQQLQQFATMVANSIGTSSNASSSGVSSGTGQVSGSGNGGPTSHNARSGLSSSYFDPCQVINENALPVDVKKRYRNNADGVPLFSTTAETPFAADTSKNIPSKLHFVLSSTITILSDGSKCVIDPGGDVLEKEFKKSFENMEVTDFTPEGLRKAYDVIKQHGDSNGVFVCPYFLLQQGTPHDLGFSFGDDATSTLPAALEDPVGRKQGGLLHRALKGIKWQGSDEKSNKLAEQIRQVITTVTNGHAALKVIMTMPEAKHPNFVDEPTTIVGEFPTQESGEMPLLFLDRVKRYLVLKSFVDNREISLNQMGTVAILFQHMQYGAFLMKTTREDRRKPSEQHKFKADKILETINMALAQSDSPAQVQALQDTTISINQLDTVVRDAPPVQQHFMLEIPVNHLKTDEGFLDTLPALKQVAVQINALGVMDQYARGCQAICLNPVAINGDPQCICCGNGDMHKFEDCPTLKDIPFLQRHHIAFCKHIRSYHKSKLLRDSDGKLKSPPPRRQTYKKQPKRTTIAHVDVEGDDASSTGSDFSKSHEEN
jgi:hypothetical protein